MARILLSLLLLFCVSDVIKTLEVSEPQAYASLCATGACKPLGVETVIYFDGRPNFGPEPKAPETQKTVTAKKTVSKPKKKEAKKAQSRKA